MFNEQMSKSPVIIEAIGRLKTRNIELITELMKDGQKKGVFRKKIDIVLMVNTLVGVVSQTVNTQAFYRKMHKQEHLTDEVFVKNLKLVLNIHIQTLVKSIITNEAA